MLTVSKQVENLTVDSLYKFRYNGKTRLAIVYDISDDIYDCFDLLANNRDGDYRKFKRHKIEGPIEDITDSVIWVEANDFDENLVAEGDYWYDLGDFVVIVRLQ